MTSNFQHMIYSPEIKTLEFKRNLSSPRNFLKTLVAFANTAGGRLVFGVDDQKNVIGIDQPLNGRNILEVDRTCVIQCSVCGKRYVSR